MIQYGDATPEEMERADGGTGNYSGYCLTMHDFYMIDAKVEEVARALGLLDIGLDRDVTDLSGGQRTKVLLGKAASGETGYSACWMSLPTIWMRSILNG